MRNYLILVRKAIIKKTNNKCLEGCEEKRTPTHALWKEL